MWQQHRNPNSIIRNIIIRVTTGGCPPATRGIITVNPLLSNNNLTARNFGSDVTVNEGVSAVLNAPAEHIFSVILQVMAHLQNST
jgi:hypothetical protein